MIKILVVLMFVSVTAFGTLNLKPESRINCYITDGANIDRCVLRSTMGSTEDSNLREPLGFEIPLNAGQLTALAAILSTGITETKSQKSIP